eukprot:gene6909-11072_t
MHCGFSTVSNQNCLSNDEVVTILDAIGPIQVFESSCVCTYFTIGEKTGLIRTSEKQDGLQINIEYEFDNHPKFDIILIPGGMGTRNLVKNEEFITKLQQVCLEAKIIATVCTGAALLDGKKATSNHRAFEWVQK